MRPFKKNVYNINETNRIKRLYQLSVGLSPIRHHKKRHNFKDTPIETCSSQVDTLQKGTNQADNRIEELEFA